MRHRFCLYTGHMPVNTEEARAAMSRMAKAQMLRQWEEKRKETGQPLGYYGCHRRVRKARGRAADQICIDCGKQARHWAHVHDTDPTDPQNYQPMCYRCHAAYDEIGLKTAASAGNGRRSEAARRMWERRTPERRTEIMRKAWEVRRGVT